MENSFISSKKSCIFNFLLLKKFEDLISLRLFLFDMNSPEIEINTVLVFKILATSNCNCDT